MLGIEVETGAAEVSLEGDLIVGKWRPTPKVVHTGARRPVTVKLLNATEAVPENRVPQAALKFTREFGALTSPYASGQPFRFSVADWVAMQKHLQRVWSLVASPSRKGAPVNIEVGKGEYFRFQPGRLTFRTQSLHMFVSLEIASVEAPRLSVCVNRMKWSVLPRLYVCKTPYFIAGDLRQRYCSAECAQEAQRLFKLRWWNENRKGVDDGSKKAQ
jgi:hypothetical protein